MHLEGLEGGLRFFLELNPSQAPKSPRGFFVWFGVIWEGRVGNVEGPVHVENPELFLCVRNSIWDTTGCVVTLKPQWFSLLLAQGRAITCGKDANLISKVCGVATSSI